MAFLKAGEDHKPKLKPPPGSTDTHLHIYGPVARYPLAPTRTNDPPMATVDDYGALQKFLGIERAVVVQPSHYGKDNRCTMDAVGRLGTARARAVVVVDTAASDLELERLTKEGARGIRFHMMPGGALPWDMLETMATRVREHGWHVQLQFNGRDLPEREALLRRLPGAMVIDHVGRYMGPVEPEHPAFKALLGLLDTGRVWVKLSAPYESQSEPGYPGVARLARALVAHSPGRMLWASNWPHPGQDAKSDADMLDLLLGWAPDEGTRRRILVDNPAALYGFA